MKKDSDIIDIETGSGKIAKDEAEHIVTTIDCVMARTNTLKVLIQLHLKRKYNACQDIQHQQ